MSLESGVLEQLFSCEIPEGEQLFGLWSLSEYVREDHGAPPYGATGVFDQVCPTSTYKVFLSLVERVGVRAIGVIGLTLGGQLKVVLDA